MAESMVSSIKEQGKAILVMMGVAIVSILAMVVLDVFRQVVRLMPSLGNGTVGQNATIQATLGLFIAAFALTGSFASITVLVIVVKVVIGVVRGLKS